MLVCLNPSQEYQATFNGVKVESANFFKGLLQITLPPVNTDGKLVVSPLFRKMKLSLSILFTFILLRQLPGAEAPGTIVSPLGQTMTLRFDDEFNGVPGPDGRLYIDRSKWQTTFWQGSSERTLLGNLEAEYYMDKDYAGRGEINPAQRINPFSFTSDGVLTISASKVPEDLWHNYWMSGQRCFASGLLISDKRFTFKYGYVEGVQVWPGQSRRVARVLVAGGQCVDWQREKGPRMAAGN